MSGDMAYVRDGIECLENLIRYARAYPDEGFDRARQYLIALKYPEVLVDDVMTIAQEALVKLYDLSKER